MGGIDIILSEYRLPSLDGMAALRRVRAWDPDLPFLLLAQEVDEALFVQALREGASDFIFKDRLLVPVILREVEKHRTRRSLGRLEGEREVLHQAIRHTTDWLLLTDLQGTILYVNPATEAITGYTAAELLGRNPRLLKSGRHPAEFYAGMWGRLVRGETWQGRISNRRKDGGIWDSMVLITPVRDGQDSTTGYALSGRSDGQDMASCG